MKKAININRDTLSAVTFYHHQPKQTKNLPLSMEITNDSFGKTVNHVSCM